MRKLEKKIMIEVFNGVEFFDTVYTMNEIRKMKCRYIGTDDYTGYNVYEINDTGELVISELM